MPKNTLRKLIMVISGAFVASALTVVAPAGADPIEIQVTILMDGAPVDGGARLTAYTQNPVTKRWDNAYTTAATDASGQITLPGLIPDSYRFCYTPEWDDTYRSGCFGAPHIVDATTFEVTGSVDLGSVNLTKKDVIDMSGLAIQGKAVVGQRLSVNTEILSPMPDQMQIYWARDGGTVPGNFPKGQPISQGASFVLQAGDVGHTIIAAVLADGATAMGSELFPGSGPIYVTRAIGPVVLPMGFSDAPKLKAAKWRKGRMAQYVAPAQVPVGATTSFQWLRNGQVLKGQTAASHKITRKDRRKRLSVRVTYAYNGYETTTMESAPSPRVK